MSRTITLIGARGGSGTSTVATALACQAATQTGVTLTGHDPFAIAHLLAIPAPLPGAPAPSVTPDHALALNAHPEERPADLRVVDAGTLDEMLTDGNEDARYLVTRGPCYLALATFVALVDGVILLTEPGRALTHANVAEVTGLPVVATIPVHARVARCIDAGLLSSSADQLTEFGELKALAGLQVELHRAAPERDLTLAHTLEQVTDWATSREGTR